MLMQAAEQLADTAPSNLNGLLLFNLLLALMLSFPISAGLIWLYRRAVTRSMRIGAGPSAHEASPPRTVRPPDQSTQKVHAPVIVDSASSTITTPAASELFSEIRHSPWRAAAVYTFAGAGYAVTMAVFTLASYDVEFLPFRFTAMLLSHAWPIVLTINLVASATWRMKLIIVGAYFLGLLILMTIGVATDIAPVSSVPQAWLMYNLPATVLLLAFLSRKIRAVGPLVLIFLILALAGPQSAISMAGNDADFLRLLVEVGALFGIEATSILALLVLFGFVLAVPISWLTLTWIRSRYDRKKISDQSITLDAVWLLFGFVNSLVLASSGVTWILSGLVAFMVYKVVVWIGFLVIAQVVSPTRRNAKLLLLRVFSLGKRSERLFEALAKHWRHGGSIQLIAGADLATDNLEPHEFLDFLSAKLGSRFINGPEAMDKRITEMDLAPDYDGRFRVNEFFCRANTWKLVLSRLVNENDAVLMDLRGFTPANQGCIHEINELINVVPLGRVQFIIDKTTFEPFLLQCMRESWEHMTPTSPNRSNGPTELRLFRFDETRSGELRRLLGSICVATYGA